MPELFLELFSEEIPARMQARAAEDLSSLAAQALAALGPQRARTWHGPRRIALALEVANQVEASETSERGPRLGAPEQAMAGFLRKHRAERADLREEGEYWVLERRTPAVAAADLIGRELPALLRRFPWPKSMRWGRSAFTWVRPLRRILCLLDGAVVPFALADGADAAHGLAAGRLTEGHRFLAPGPCAVEGADDWATKLRARHVMADAAERRGRIRAGLAALAADRGLTVVPDDGLLTEVAGLVEWPVPFLGRIDKAYMDLPPEVLQVSMRVNQRTFAMRDAAGAAAPWFGFVANIEPADGGAATIAGNERVLRARFADARHFWDLDRRVRLSHRMAALEGVTFHAKLGTQWQRTLRIVALAQVIAAELGADPDHARLAALLAKADLTTGMVGEFPELQGIMGGYYAAHDGDPAPVAAAIRDHYLPKGPSDPVPTGLGAVIALADKIDQLLSFFSIGEKPTGSGDPYALRRAGLGVIRTVIENGLRLRLLDLLRACEGAWRRETGGRDYTTELCADVFQFLLERLRVMLRNQGARHDVLNAVITDDRQDLTDLMLRTDAIAAFLATPDGHDLLTGYRRAANILRIEEQKDGRYTGDIDRALLREPEEYVLADRLADDGRLIAAQMAGSATYPAAMATLSQLRAPLDAFFNRVTVNAAEANLRRNRLALLSQVRSVMDRVADFSRIEG
jgi:glycyl-tRNA synthetase beta chain